MIHLPRTLAFLVSAPLLAAAVAASPAPAVAAPEQPASPSFPGPPSVVDLLPTRATLVWEPPGTDPLVTYYRIYQVTTVDGRAETRFLNGTSTTSFVAAVLKPDTEYTYVVETGDETSNGLRSPAVTFRTPPAPDETEPPTAPGAPVATATGPNDLTLTWAPSIDDSGVAYYDVVLHRAIGGTVVAGRTITTTDWTATQQIPDFDYAYHVVAVDHSGNGSAPSEVVRVRMPADPRNPCQQVRSIASERRVGHFEAEVTIANTGRWADAYTVRFLLAPGQRVTEADHPWAQVGNEVLLWYQGWAGGLWAGENTFRLSGTHTGANPPPTDIRLNGNPCAPH
ncbi:MAG TPA: cellulose binding domain-containing protein [Micromonosporaceae bacterium]|nr:cellulose binding domain-containing protein [Micromonosporaceae bacterium]